jgi:hypothetical protein
MIKEKITMWEIREDKAKLFEVKRDSENKVIDMRTWLQQKKEATKNVLMFTPRLTTVGNDNPPTVA